MCVCVCDWRRSESRDQCPGSSEPLRTTASAGESEHHVMTSVNHSQLSAAATAAHGTSPDSAVTPSSTHSDLDNDDPVRSVAEQHDSTHFTFANSPMTSHHRITTSSDHRIVNDVSPTNNQVLSSHSKQMNKDSLPVGKSCDATVGMSMTSSSRSRDSHESLTSDKRALSWCSVDSLTAVLGSERTQRLMKNISDINLDMNTSRQTTSHRHTQLHTNQQSHTVTTTTTTTTTTTDGDCVDSDEARMQQSSLAVLLHDVTSLRHSDVSTTSSRDDNSPAECSNNLQSRDNVDNTVGVTSRRDEVTRRHDDNSVYSPCSDEQLDDVDDVDAAAADDVLVQSSSSVQQHIDAIKDALRHQ